MSFKIFGTGNSNLPVSIVSVILVLGRQATLHFEEFLVFQELSDRCTILIEIKRCECYPYYRIDLL